MTFSSYKTGNEVSAPETRDLVVDCARPANGCVLFASYVIISLLAGGLVVNNRDQ